MPSTAEGSPTTRLSLSDGRRPCSSSAQTALGTVRQRATTRSRCRRPATSVGPASTQLATVRPWVTACLVLRHGPLGGFRFRWNGTLRPWEQDPSAPARAFPTPGGSDSWTRSLGELWGAGGQDELGRSFKSSLSRSVGRSSDSCEGRHVPRFRDTAASTAFRDQATNRGECMK